MSVGHREAGDGRESSGLILMYHRIVRHEPAGRLAVTLEHFEEHLRVLRHSGYTVLPLATLAAAAARRDLPPRAVALTFDDGYADHLEDTTELLTRYAVPATFFIVGRALAPGYRFWWDTLGAIFASDRWLPPTLTLSWRSHLIELRTATEAERVDAQTRVTQLCYEASLEERDQLMTRLLTWGGYASTPGRPRPITAAELCDLAAVPGAAIGVHTENHLWLPSQPAVVQQQEMSACRQRLEGLLGTAITSLAYPYGAHDAHTIELARQMGFLLAVTTAASHVTPGENLLRLPRHEVADSDGNAFSRWLTSAPV